MRITTLATMADEAAGGDVNARLHLLRQAKADLSNDVSDGTARRPFHWPLEFPEVFLRDSGGFDALVGNPPFLGGKRITGAMGTAFRDWLVAHVAEGRRGSADLVAYFFLRAWSLMRSGGGFGLLAVNTIAEGDTRQVGLEAMIGAGAIIHAAYPNEPWPGKAAVVTSRVHVRKGAWDGTRSLLGRSVKFISAYLSDQDEWSPTRLKRSEGKSFQGSIVIGMGFLLSHDDAQQMLDADIRNADVIFPYINGDDLNSDPSQKPSRWVVNFWDWSEHKARSYDKPWRWIEARVQPERQRRDENGDYVLRNPLPQRWWQYGDKRPALYHTIGRGHFFEHHPEGWVQNSHTLPSVLAIPETTKYCLFSLVENDIVFSHMLKIISDDSYEMFCILNSAIHESWARKQSSTLETRLKYINTAAFETFPFPDIANIDFEDLGMSLSELRRGICLSDQIGLTKLYNLVHKCPFQKGVSDFSGL